MNIDIKTAFVFFGLGVAQGLILCDWARDRAILRRYEADLQDGRKVVMKRKTA